MTLFCGQFKKYKLSPRRIKNICINSGGVLGAKLSNFKGIFDILKHMGVPARDVIKVLDYYPEFALQNRENLLWKKWKIIRKESGRDDIYLRNFMKRHPDIMIKSLASLEAKVNYVARILNRTLKYERAFPLLLHFNYNDVIRPRGDLLRAKHGPRGFDLRQAFGHSDQKFCKFYDIDP
eukprot:CAMPEP_0170485584 /NCGR_PEP_ID=MMETSP0208-20121228/4828_1 /TAXON_ID=197538 /ORGANISM="Strombidium inclinatum, Strain S3" /LENGTH=178 /DNA_ID=CAMNT_0010759283 /DNA_START=729 /DNA_END=1265 /DNA_ORIENTATION=-